MTPDLDALADRAENIHHRDLERAVTDLYRYETALGPLTQADLLELVDIVGENQEAASWRPIAAIYRAQIRDELLAFKAYLLCVGRRRKLFARLIAALAVDD